MTPQTRSSIKSPPGRSTRNSVYGRSPLPPTSPRKRSTDTSAVKSPVKPAPAHEKGAVSEATSNTSGTPVTPWLACRDPNGVLTTVAVTETGEGIHLRWHYFEDDREVDEDADIEMMTIDEERGVTPITAGPSNAVRPPFPQTPMAPHPYDAGSVILTPVKKAKPLQRSPQRIGDKGIRCLYEKSGVLRDFNGEARIVLRHPMGSTTNLSRQQVERLEKEREDKIVQVQMEKLLSEKKREEPEHFADSGFGDDAETDASSVQRGFQREGTGDTILISHSDLSGAVTPVSQEETENVSGVFRGPNGELLDHRGHQMLGPEGTILIDSGYASPRRIKRQETFLTLTEIEDSSFNHCAREANGSYRPRFGPEGTELVI